MNGSMWPIQGLSKAKRLKWGPEQNQISWAYMKELREHNDTREIYDADPYIEVYQLDDNLYGLFNQNCDDMGDVWEYLIIGPEKAMLIDTAFGIGDIPKLCEELIDGKELIVANTHGGPDHCLGNVRFDKVYCYEKEYDGIKNRVKPDSWDYLFDENGNFIWLEFDKDALPVYRDYELVPVENHHIFSLGQGYDVELIWMPGHAAGHCVFLDKPKKRVFAGDCICSDVMSCGGGGPEGNPLAKYQTIEAYHQELSRLCERLDEFDSIYPGHFQIALDSYLFLDVLQTLEEILKNPDKPSYCKEVTNRRGEKRTNYYKYVPGFTVIQYDINRGVYCRD